MREPAAESFLLVFLTRDRRDDVLDFYRTEFQKYGWTLQDGEQLGVQQQTNFRDSAGDIQGTILLDAFDRDPRYTEVNVQFRQSPSRPPASEQESTPPATTTPPPATAVATP